GNVTLLSSIEALATVTASIAPDVAELGQFGSELSMAALDGGATLSSGENAAGRRVLLPWGGNNMDVNSLNEDGLTVFKRSLEWGTGVGCGSMRPLLLVVGDSNNPSSDDVTRQSLITSWCYAVSLIDASAQSSAFNSASAAHDVIYISENVDHAALHSKVKNQPIGIVSEERFQHARLGFSGDLGASANLKRTNVVDNTHPVTSGLSLGDLQITSSNQPMQNLQGTLSPDLVTLGTHPSNGLPSLAVLEAGAEVWNGDDPVPANRVFLPWGGDAFEFESLNTDGQRIMRQAIEWAAGGSSTQGSNDAEQLTGDGTMYVDSTDLELADNLGSSSQPTDIVGIRFPGVAVPAGESVTSAYIQFQVDELDSGAASLTIEGEAADNALPFSTTPYDITTRPRTTASVGWSPPVWTTVGERGPDQRTPDLSPIVQEIVNRPGWTEGNSIVFIISGSGVRTAEAYEGDPAGAPTFHVDYGSGGGGGGTAYVESNQAWSATSDDQWQTVDLGVPSNAVVEVAIINEKDKNERRGGVRQVGSSLDRRFQLHEAESGGTDALVLHVQADSNGRIQHYAEKRKEVTFKALGYWTGATYTELTSSFAAGGSNSWQTRSLSSYGVPPGSIVELAIANTSTSSEYRAGARKSGSSTNRTIDIHEAESGGNDYLTLMVEAGSDAAASIEVMAESNSNIEFTVVGYWDTPPGTYIEIGAMQESVNQADAWHNVSLTPWGVPANSVLQLAIANANTSAERQIGIRQSGSSQNRVLDLQEAESGGVDMATLNVNVTGSTEVQVYVESSTSNVYFYPLGLWTFP
ncbi:MAG: hypothetical protein KJO82_02350, partial [Gammaproteobacteria bacterium]|nr:hypothetical protein [Gammaproteobacteria bacterium]